MTREKLLFIALVILIVATSLSGCVGIRFGNTCNQFGLLTETVEVLDMDAASPEDSFTETTFKCVPKGKGNYTRGQRVQ